MRNIPQWKKSIRYAYMSDVGMRRSSNQDYYGFQIANTIHQWLIRGHLFVVADGMGAHAAGEVASKMAVDTVIQSYTKRTSEIPIDALAHAVMDAHNRIRERGRREDAFHDMGTTCDAFAMIPQGLIIAHVGDSRVYRIRANLIEQLTFDHSLVWEICEANKLPFDCPPYHIPKNQITRSLGPTENLVVDVEGPHRIYVGDIFLSCSDGLSGQVKDYEIGEIASVLQPDIAAETLINIANLRGGPDNTTILIVKAISDAAIEQAVDESLTMPLRSKFLILIASILTAALFVALFQGNFLLSVVTGSIAAAAAICFFISTQSYLLGNSPFANTEVKGNAPYTNTICQPDEKLTFSLAKLLADVRQAIKDNAIEIKSKEADDKEQKALTATQHHHYTEAIQNYSIAINLLMREIKKGSSPKIN
ncbi:MAG: protein phosphatase 2C domain-containing protein [Planctomycetaceae bacterium]|jgi:protein phosphatase|nr:protein phosphatase 2C domain-containing protein [Planctomycetaceae bacterium]